MRTHIIVSKNMAIDYKLSYFITIEILTEHLSYSINSFSLHTTLFRINSTSNNRKESLTYRPLSHQRKLIT